MWFPTLGAFLSFVGMVRGLYFFMRSAIQAHQSQRTVAVTESELKVIEILEELAYLQFNRGKYWFYPSLVLLFGFLLWIALKLLY